MKYYIFFREDNKFDDILKDIILKKLIDQKISWYQHLMIGMIEDEKTTSYITLKYGDEMVNEVVKDHSPIPGVDYTPKRNIV
jgi:hypothetical protein